MDVQPLEVLPHNVFANCRCIVTCTIIVLLPIPEKLADVWANAALLCHSRT